MAKDDPSKAAPLKLHPDRLFPADPATRKVARALYESVADLPIVSPHGHTDPRWFADDEPFANPAALIITPDHYVYRMLYSQGVKLADLGLVPASGDRAGVEQDPRAIWRRFAKHYHLFAGTPTRLWHDWMYSEAFGLDVRLNGETADLYYDSIAECLKRDEFRPRALFERYGIEVIATTEDPLDPLNSHKKLQTDGWGERVVTAFRPDNVCDPDYEEFAANLTKLGEITGEDTGGWSGYLAALRDRRAYFRKFGATSTDHGHPTATTANLPDEDAAALYARVRGGGASAEDAETFRGQMLTEMARMSLADGMVMQIHPGSYRNHNPWLFETYGRDKGADIPARTDYVRALKPLLEAVGNEPDLTIILFTLDESVYTRELAPLAGHYPVLKLGPPWWFHDSPEGMRRFHEQVTETAGFYNTVGFNDDTRALLSIPARHDVARRMDCAFLGRLVAEHRLEEDEAHDLARGLAYDFAKRAYKL